uniref:Uncharacterized protein n=1 Tax=viral metagenome TaxID=1070528 RepID=A0A6C0KVV0_9ZZZZ
MAAASTSRKHNFIITDDSEVIKNVDMSKYKSLPWMTKYEFDQVIGLRTMHLSINAIPFVKLPENFTIKSNMELRKIAIQELNEKKLPYIIKRPMPPNGEAEYWPLAKLNLDTVMHMMR